MEDFGVAGEGYGQGGWYFLNDECMIIHFLLNRWIMIMNVRKSYGEIMK